MQHANGQKMHHRHSSLVALVEMLIISNCGTTRIVQCRDGFTRSGSPHRSLVLSSLCCIVALRTKSLSCGRLLVVSTRQAEAANGPTLTSLLRRRAGSPSSPHHFVSFLISFRFFRFLQQPPYTERQRELHQHSQQQL